MKNLKKEPSLTDKAYTAIKAAIISNELPPNAVLAEENLAAQLGISRTPIRAALQRLQLEKIVVSSGKKLVVAEVTAQEVRDINLIRIHLEPLSIPLISQRGGLTAREISQLHNCNERQREAAKTGDNLTFLEQDAKFHVMLAQLSENHFLYDLVSKSNLTIQRFHTLTGTLSQNAPLAVEEHKEILDALKEKDYPRAEAALRSHLELVDHRILR